jgi:GT2 family glycosyltransferase
VVVPTYNTPVKLLDKMVESIRNQLYDSWELCIADDHSTDKRTRSRLEYWVNRDKRIQVSFREENGHISECTNTAIDMVSADYIALVDHDDELPAHALYYVANELRNHPEAQIIYSDEDKITPDGYRLDPYFKSDFGPDLLCSHNFVSHLGVYRKDLLKKIGGFRKDYVGSQDWDLVLRCLDHIDGTEIRHIPRILYHWRLSNDSTSASVGNKGYAVTSGRRALQEYLDKHEPTGKVENGPTFGSFRIRYATPGDPLASIIILTKNNAAILKQCVDSILSKTSYKHFEVLIVDNGSDEPEAKELLASLQSHDSIRVFDKPVPFNFSGLNNGAAAFANGEVLVFLNNDMEVIEEDWLRELVSHAIRPKVGPVGTKLLYPDDYIQHAGMIMGIGGTAGHAFKYLHRQNPGHIGRAGIIQNYSAVTAACMAIRKSVFEELGGFDAEHLATAYNDADLCLRAWEIGYRTVYTPHALLYHHESASRGQENSSLKKERWQKEADYVKKKWKSVIQNDPFYNPALSLLTEDFGLAKPPRYERPWASETESTIKGPAA